MFMKPQALTSGVGSATTTFLKSFASGSCLACKASSLRLDAKAICLAVVLLPKPSESQSKPGIKMVYPEPCKELRRRSQLFLAGTAPY